MKDPKRQKASHQAWDTIRENQYEDILEDRALKAVRTRKLSARAKKAWRTRKSSK